MELNAQFAYLKFYSLRLEVGEELLLIQEPVLPRLQERVSGGDPANREHAYPVQELESLQLVNINGH